TIQLAQAFCLSFNMGKVEAGVAVRGVPTAGSIRGSYVLPEVLNPPSTVVSSESVIAWDTPINGNNTGLIGRRGLSLPDHDLHHTLSVVTGPANKRENNFGIVDRWLHDKAYYAFVSLHKPGEGIAAAGKGDVF